MAGKYLQFIAVVLSFCSGLAASILATASLLSFSSMYIYITVLALYSLLYDLCE